MPTKQDISDRLFTVCRPGHEKTNPELAELLMAFGLASWTWTHTESRLFLLFAHLIEPKTNNNSKAIRAAFFSIVSPMGRLDMINSVVNSSGDDERVKQWSRLYKECRKQLTTRGKLAHLVGYSYKAANKEVRAILMEPIWHPNTRRTHAEANSVQYTAEHLNRLATDWHLLAEKIHLFILFVGEQDSLSESAQSIARLLASPGDLSTQTHPKPSSRAKSSRK
jgi:hypothetical protein